MNVNKRH